MKKNYVSINEQTINRWVKEGWQWGIPIDHQTFENAKKWYMGCCVNTYSQCSKRLVFTI